MGVGIARKSTLSARTQVPALQAPFLAHSKFQGGPLDQDRKEQRCVWDMQCGYILPSAYRHTAENWSRYCWATGRTSSSQAIPLNPAHFVLPPISFNNPKQRSWTSCSMK